MKNLVIEISEALDLSFAEENILESLLKRRVAKVSKMYMQHKRELDLLSEEHCKAIAKRNIEMVGSMVRSLIPEDHIQVEVRDTRFTTDTIKSFTYIPVKL